MKRLLLFALTALLALPCAANADVVFSDNFTTADDASINTGLPNAARQTATSSTYELHTDGTMENAGDTIVSNTFQRAAGAQTDTSSNFFSALGTNDFTYSADFQFITANGVNWSSFSIVGDNVADDLRAESGISVLLRGNGNAINIAGGAGNFNGAAITGIAGLESWDVFNQHNYKFAATATDVNTGTFDFLIDDIVVSTTGAYTFASSVRELSFVQQGGVTVQFDNLTLTSVPEPSSLAVLAMGSVALLIRRRK